LTEEEQIKLIEEALNSSRPSKASSKPSQQETNNNGSLSASSYCPLSFKDAAEFLYFFDPALRDGRKKLYAWQIETLRFLSQKGKFTTEHPLDFTLLAANGSGKDAYIIAGFVCYVLCCWTRYKIVITSSSDQQLDSQTRNYIKYFSEQINDYLRQSGILQRAIDVKKETFKSTVHQRGNGKSIALTGTEVYTFVTNMGGRAEGHHPFPDATPGEGVIIIVNEAKTVPQEIYDHFAKCTYNYFIQVSSAGPNRGQLFNTWIKGVEYPAEYVKGKPYGRRITAYDCPHISKSKLENELAEYGPNDPWFKNTRLSLFTSLGESVVITEELLDKCLATSARMNLGLGRRAGLDLSGRGNDFNTFYVVEENELIAYERWRAADTEHTVDILAGDDKTLGMFAKYGFTMKDAPLRISGDDNGIGQGIIDGLARKGWNIRRVLNQSSAINNGRFLNRGAEMWFTFARIIEAGFFYCKPELMHPKLRTQLCNRHYTQEGAGKLKLWSKKEEKAGAKGKVKGNYVDDDSDSPDDADAVVLAFSTVSVFDYLNGPVKKDDKRYPTLPTTKDIITNNRSVQHKMYFPETPVKRVSNNLVDIVRSLYG